MLDFQIICEKPYSRCNSDNITVQVYTAIPRRRRLGGLLVVRRRLVGGRQGDLPRTRMVQLDQDLKGITNKDNPEIKFNILI